MTKFVIASDEKDDELGNFFHDCAKDVLQMIDSSSDTTEIITVTSARLNQVFIELELSKLNNGFAFLCYSHGSEDSLHGDGAFISTEYNTQLLRNTISFTFACHTAKRLGPKVVELGGRSYFGYNSYAYVVKEYSNIYVNCANYGFKMLLEGKSTYESYTLMKTNYSLEIDSLREDNFLAAAYLRKNRDAFVHQGDDNLKLSDLENY